MYSLFSSALALEGFVPYGVARLAEGARLVEVVLAQVQHGARVGGALGPGLETRRRLHADAQHADLVG